MREEIGMGEVELGGAIWLALPLCLGLLSCA
jgi:hypothetical protein